MVYLCILWNPKISICKTFSKKLIMPSQVGGEMSLMDLGRYAGKAGKKAAEMSRFFASE